MKIYPNTYYIRADNTKVYMEYTANHRLRGIDNHLRHMPSEVAEYRPDTGRTQYNTIAWKVKRLAYRP